MAETVSMSVTKKLTSAGVYYSIDKRLWANQAGVAVEQFRLGRGSFVHILRGFQRCESLVDVSFCGATTTKGVRLYEQSESSSYRTGLIERNGREGN